MLLETLLVVFGSGLIVQLHLIQKAIVVHYHTVAKCHNDLINYNEFRRILDEPVESSDTDVDGEHW